MKTRIALLVLFMSLASQNIRAQSTSTSEEAQSQIPITGIQVTAGRQVNNVRSEIDRAQDKVYDLFNDLNDVNEFDIHCEMFAELGTKIKSKVCLPNFYQDAREVRGKAYIVPSGYGNSMAPVSAVIAQKTPILKEKFIALAKENPALGQAIFEHSDLQEELKGLLNP